LPQYPQEVNEFPFPLEPIHTRHQSALLGLCDAAQQLNVEQIAVVELPYLLAPPDLLDRSIRWHLHCGNSYTITDGIPRSTSPIIYDSRFLKQLALLKLPEASDDPFRIAEM